MSPIPEGIEATVKVQSPAGTESDRGRAIEFYLSAAELSVDGRGERYQRGKTPHTIFTWWARRPFSAMRGVVEAALAEVEDSLAPTSRSVLDMFAGGGTIPLEAAKAGAHAVSLENNELAHFIQVALLEWSQVDCDLPNLVRKHGTSLLRRLEEETSSFFPGRRSSEEGNVIAYFWSRSGRCPSCAGSLSFQKRPWLSKKNDRRLWVRREPDFSNRVFRSEICSGATVESTNAWDKNVVRCPFCDHVVPREIIGDYFAEFGFDEMTAYVTKLAKGKGFTNNQIGQMHPEEQILREAIRSDLALLRAEMPSAPLPRWSGIANPALYGFSKVSDLYTLRQQAVLIRLCRLLHQEQDHLVTAYGRKVSLAITAFLSAFIDQLADWNCRLSMWIPQNEQVGRALSGPGLPMMWDFVEIDPLQHGPANLWDKLDRVVAGLESIPRFAEAPSALPGDARRLPFADASFDAVITDPPYFDNLFYHLLADCIYIWKRLVFKKMLPHIFSGESTDSVHELSASKHRSGTAKDASEFFSAGMTAALMESRRVLKKGGVLSLIFAHSSIGGWTSIVEALRLADFELVVSWKMNIERRHRPRGMRSAAVNASFVLVAKPRPGERPSIEWSELECRLREVLGELAKDTVGLGEDPGEGGQTLLGKGIEIVSQVGEIRDGSDRLSSRHAIERLADIVESVTPGFKVARR